MEGVAEVVLEGFAGGVEGVDVVEGGGEQDEPFAGHAGFTSAVRKNGGVVADGDEDVGGGGGPADAVVVAGGFVAEFEHVAEDGDAAAFHREAGEGVEGGEHGGGVGVVGVVEEGGPGGGAAKGHAVGGGLEGSQGVERRLEVETKGQDGSGGGAEDEIDRTGHVGGVDVAASLGRLYGDGCSVAGDLSVHDDIG